MGEALLRAHVQALRQRLEALPAPVQVQRLVLEDNVVEFKVIPQGDVDSDRGKRLNFLIYETDAYPNSGGVMMTEDEQDEALVEAINARMGDPESVIVADAVRAACLELDVRDPALLACLTPDGLEGCGPAAGSGTRPDVSFSVSEAEANLSFEGEDEDGPVPNYSMYVGSVADRENRPGWKKLKWQETEEQRVARRKEQQRRVEHEPGQKRRKGGGGEMTLEEQKAADEQMWSSQEAFTILSNELFALQTEADPALEADATNYDVHQWTVRLRHCSGPLGQDLQELHSRFGYDYIELHLAFKEDLHPFYPPTASVVRPRLHGRHDVLAALACHPRLQLRGWSPFQTTKDLLMSIRHFFESIARVDLMNQQNDLTRFPNGAFSPLERQLAQLGNLCEIVPLDLRSDSETNPYRDDPWAKHEALTQSSLGAMLARRKVRETASGSGHKGQNFWAAGTGYGHDTGPHTGGGGMATWDPQAMRAAQIAQDEELQQLIKAISASLHANSGTLGSQEQDRGQVLLDLLSKSCIVPFLVRELSISYTNMGERVPFFEEVFRLVQELLRALPERAATLLEPAREHLEIAKKSAQTFLTTLGASASRADLSDDVSFAQSVVRTADEVQRLCSAQGPQSTPTLECGGSSSSSAMAPANADEEAEYCRCMRLLQLDQSDMTTGHTYKGPAQAESVAPQARTVRMAKELAGLASLLPLSGSSSVFVRVSAMRQQLWRALVTGPDDTPYSGGCFVFDVYFPPQYPAEPPKVKLLTTGHNSVTFNPNLYESGKVCLSLLGTWKGDKAESWDPTSSRMLQVLVSIQSLILVPDPYFNEPGYEREIGTKQGDNRSREYNMSVRENCARWAMVDVLKNPLPEFREVIAEHFRIRGPRIKETLRQWVAEAERHGCNAHKACLTSLLGTFTEELNKLGRTSAMEVGHAEAVPGG